MNWLDLDSGDVLKINDDYHQLALSNINPDYLVKNDSSQIIDFFTTTNNTSDLIQYGKYYTETNILDKKVFMPYNVKANNQDYMPFYHGKIFIIDYTINNIFNETITIYFKKEFWSTTINNDGRNVRAPLYFPVMFDIVELNFSD